jgi:hypothetical protein
MQKRILSLLLPLLLSLSLAGAQPIPALHRQGSATQLIVHDRPFLIFGGELGNSTASSLQDMEEVCSQMQQMQLNTLLVPAYWELLEPEENRFDFSLIDGILDHARRHDLKIVFLWFGAWKNSMSCYAPPWVKEDYKKYPRAITQSGRPLEILSAFDNNNRSADRRAFRQFMSHLAQVDREQQTVILVQVENEIGMLENARDHSPAANAAFHSPVPQALIDYLTKNQSTLQPRLSERWTGNRTQGTWTEVFGEGTDTDEIFMAWHYGLFVQSVAQAGKEAYPLPLYLNAALNSRGRTAGQYPSAGPLAHLLDIWRAAAPAIDFLAPDIYDPGFIDWCRQYHTNGNPLFIPEIRLHEADAVRALYAFGEHDALGFSPFSVEDIRLPAEYPLAHSYRLLRQLLPFLTEKQGLGQTNGILLADASAERIIERNAYTFTFRHAHTLGWDLPKDASAAVPETGAILIELSENEYLIAGSGIVVTFGNTRRDGRLTGISFIDEVEIRNGRHLVPLRRLNGDQDHQGRHLRIPSGKWSILHLRLYDYGK